MSDYSKRVEKEMDTLAVGVSDLIDEATANLVEIIDEMQEEINDLENAINDLKEENV